MNKAKELDKRQAAFVRVLMDAAETFEPQLDLVLQHADYAGLSESVRRAARISEQQSRKPWILRAEGVDGAYHALMGVGARLGTKGCGYMGRLDRVFERARAESRDSVCIVLDHAGRVHPETLARMYRCATEGAERFVIGLRFVAIITRIVVWNPQRCIREYRLPEPNLVLKRRARVWEYNEKFFKLYREPEAVRLVKESTPNAYVQEEAALKRA